MIELLVVIAIIAVLVALLLPAVQAAREAARRTQCANNLKQLGLAVHNYHEVYDMIPMGNDWKSSSLWGGWDYNAGVFTRLLPYLDQAPLYETIDFNKSLFHATNISIWDQSLNVLICPTDSAEKKEGFDPGDFDPEYPGAINIGFTNYAASAGPRLFLGGSFNAQPPRDYHEGLFWDDHSRVQFSDIRDGQSQTLMFAERGLGYWPDADRKWYGWWASGYPVDSMFVTYVKLNAPKDQPVIANLPQFARVFGSASSFHSGGAYFCFADGSVKFLSENIDSWDLSDAEIFQLLNTNVTTQPYGVYQKLSTRNGKDIISGY